MKKKLLIAFIAIIAAVCGAFGLTACGDDSGNSDNVNNGINSKVELVYQLNDDGKSYSVAGVKKFKGDEIVIPAEYDNKPVTGIGAQAFNGCERLVSLTIPDSITSIGEYAFDWCRALEKIDYKGEIGKWCQISGLKNISYSNFSVYINGQKSSEFTEVVIPDGVTSIEEEAFMGFYSLECVIIPDSVTSIGKYAFAGISSLKSITIGNGVTSIGENAFDHCPIETATIPAFACEYIKSSSALKTVVITSGDNIDEYAFTYCGLLESITISDSVTSIGEMAFSYCYSLKSVIIPDSVTNIGENAFMECPIETATIPAFACEYVKSSSALKTVVITSGDGIGEYALSGSSLTGITVPDSVTSIGEGAFSSSSLTDITIPDSVKNIGKKAFEGCPIKSITIPDSVTSIGENAFNHCPIETAIIPAFACEYIKASAVLKSVVITSGDSIDEYAFKYCDTLENITVNSENEKYSTQDGILYDKEKTEIIFVPKAIKGTVNIPDSVTSIGYNAFSGCKNLLYNEYDNAYYLGNGNNPYLLLVKAKSKDITSCNINEKTKFVHGSAFENCRSLESVKISDRVTEIDNNTFKNCNSLKSVTLGNSVTHIGYNAFDGCGSLKSVTIGNGVTFIGKDAFKDCPVETATVPSSVCEYIKNSKLKTLVITGGEYIANAAFRGCSLLEDITIPDSVTDIGEEAFRGCSALKSITMPDSVTKIGARAFYDCSSLTNATIGKGVTSIGANAFSGCRSVANIIIPFVGGSKDVDMNSHFGYLFGAPAKEDNSRYVPSSLKTVIITGGENIYYGAFKNCSAIKRVSIPESVINIGLAAFEGCSSLEEIKYTGSAASWCQISGLNNLDKNKVYIGEKKLTEMTSIVISAGVTDICDYAFSGCIQLTEISIPESVIHIGLAAFEGCGSLEEIKFKDISNYCRINGLNNLDKEKVYIGEQKLTEMTSIIIPEGVTDICDYAFSGCTQLTDISIPDSVVNISSTAFSGCDQLIYMENGVKYIACLAVDMYMETGVSYSSIFIKDGTKIIGAGALDWNIYNYLVIPDSVKSIGDSACSGQTILFGVTIGNGTEVIGKSAFSGCRGLRSITIGSSVTSIGQWTFNGCSSLTSITFEGTKEEWNAIEKGNGWNAGTGSYTIHCKNGDIEKE